MNDGDDEQTPASTAELQAQLVRFVQGRDVACPGCGYNVRNLRADCCPECGEKLQLRLGLVEPRRAALIAGLVGLAAGAGLGGLLLIYAALVIAFGRSGDWGDFLIVVGGGFVTHGALLGLWIRYWNTIRRAKPVARRMMVIACWGLPLIFVAVLAARVR